MAIPIATIIQVVKLLDELGADDQLKSLMKKFLARKNNTTIKKLEAQVKENADKIRALVTDDAPPVPPDQNAPQVYAVILTHDQYLEIDQDLKSGDVVNTNPNTLQRFIVPRGMGIPVPDGFTEKTVVP